MQELFAPMEVTVAEIGLAKTNPHQDLIRVELNHLIDKKEHEGMQQDIER